MGRGRAVRAAPAIAAEFVPWARVQLTGVSARADTGGAALSVTLDRVVSAEGLAFQLGMVILLGAVGFALTCPVARRRVAMGTTIGIGAGVLLLIISVARAALHTFDTLSGLSTIDRSERGFDIVLGPGVYVAAAAVLLLVSAAVTAALRHRAGWAEEPPARRPPAEPVAEDADRSPAEPGVFGPDGERELTVTPLEPMDESYFARPDQR